MEIRIYKILHIGKAYITVHIHTVSLFNLSESTPCDQLRPHFHSYFRFSDGKPNAIDKQDGHINGSSITSITARLNYHFIIRTY